MRQHPHSVIHWPQHCCFCVKTVSAPAPCLGETGAWRKKRRRWILLNHFAHSAEGPSDRLPGWHAECVFMLEQPLKQQLTRAFTGYAELCVARATYLWLRYSWKTWYSHISNMQDQSAQWYEYSPKWLWRVCCINIFLLQSRSYPSFNNHSYLKTLSFYWDTVWGVHFSF